MNNYLERSKQLLGEARINSLENFKVAVIGLGGVGGTALEALARSGFKKFILVDCDKVDVTNLNRQLLFIENDIGKSKTEVAESRIKSINPEIECEIISEKIDEGSMEKLFKTKPDIVVDAIDFVPGKLDIYSYCLKNKIPFISSLGMGNRIDPEKVVLTRLNKTENDPLAKKIRYEAKQKGLDISLINVVFSKEEPIIKLPKPASMMMVPSTAGLLIAKYLIDTIK